MMKNMRILAWTRALAAAVLACVLALAAWAAVPARAMAVEVNQPDASAGISLIVKDQHDGVFNQGTQVDIYRVAEVGDNGALTPVGDFASLPVSWEVADESDARALADTLHAYVARDGFAATDTALTDGNGVASFPASSQALEPGYYLVLAQAHQTGNAWHRPVASLVALPHVYEDGTIEYAPIITLKYQEYEETRSLDVLKVWEGEGDPPKSVIIQLLRDGEVWRTAVLSEANGWHVTWTGLDPQYEWMVLEENVAEGYTVSLVEGNGIVAVTNTLYNDPTEEPENPDNPTNPDGPDNPNGGEPGGSTGDGSGSGTDSKLPQTGQLWWPVAALLVAGVALLLAGVSRKLRS